MKGRVPMLGENITLAWRSLMANKLRTFLTMLGIIIGIAAVIAITTIGNSTVEQTKKEYSQMGTNVINYYIYEDYTMSDTDDAGNVTEPADTSSQPQFTKDMMEKMVAKFGDKIDCIMMQAWLTSTQAKRDSASDSKTANITVQGVNNGFFKLPTNNFQLTAGTTFQEGQMGADDKVCIVSDKLVDNLFDGDYEGAIGQDIEFEMSDMDLGGQDENRQTYIYTIIGVYAYQIQGQDFQNSADMKNIQTDLYIPYLNAQSLVKYESGKQINYFSLNAKPGEDVFTLTDDIKAYLQSLVPAGTNAIVDGDNNATYIEQAEASVKQKSLQAALVGAIALLVGGIGVMNIMTVTIVERTKEIGTRKALGALNSDIRSQFITEAIMICLIGGAIGIAGGISIGFVACKMQGIAPVLSFKQIGIFFLISLAIGVFFGYYPAAKAARMNPIDALRYE